MIDRMTVIFLLALFCPAAAGTTDEMHVETAANLRIILLPDFTWQFEEQSDTVLTAETSLTLTNGRVIILDPAKTWRFSEGRDGNNEEYSIGLENAYATGYARQKTFQEALTAARKEAVRRLSLQLKSAQPGSFANVPILLRCIESESKEEEVTRKSADLCEVTIKMTLGKQAIQNILACMEKKPVGK
jgi:hypothetical protein